MQLVGCISGWVVWLHHTIFQREIFFKYLISSPFPDIFVERERERERERDARRKKRRRRRRRRRKRKLWLVELKLN
ncbi:hypothetical protein RHMOL_Rhmol10G0133000 [Rhododendron molle]|uniref:Uncharacterized protein n=2 Tax=Rhododendron molle TaxID=49168 RepID=A0ACC0M1W0_RHOML|nr:hypothetical protein RHMOL_Rhmol10G0133000 [Rhododendron molle]KAI8534906.1 hypothetical protein RHMOL_Rhmol10G0133000 [Rhododendron molle]